MPTPHFIVWYVGTDVFLLFRKNRYLSTNLAVRLSPGFSLAASGMLIHTKDVRKD